MIDQLIVRPMTLADLRSVAQVHCVAFQGFFLDQMGLIFLRAYYKVVLRYQDSIALVAEDADGRIAGFAIGFVNPTGFYAFLKSEWLRLVAGAVIGLLRRPQLLGRVLMNRSRVSNNSKSEPEADVVELASIAVAEREHGLGSCLIAAFIKQAKLLGGSRITLTTDLKDNAAVQQFYRKHGFIEKGVEMRKVREMLCFELALHSIDAVADEPPAAGRRPVLQS
jgi:GNAT superfamily N-acetyltransferase